jgi:hypothetical protein
MNLKYDAPPTVAAFMQSAALVRLILGPVGSGKSTGCLIEVARRSIEQRPGLDGVRRTRWVAVRQTLKQLKDTVLPEFYTWLAPLVEYKVSDQIINFRIPDLNVVSQINLIPLDDEADQRRLLSSQITGAWVNEFPEIEPAIISSLLGRCGRYPSAAQGGASWFGVIGDGNFPTEGSDWHELLEMNRPQAWDLFKQPGGMCPNEYDPRMAENLNYLLQTPETLLLPVDHPARLAQGRKYYENQINGPNKDWIKRYVHAQYGNDPSGTAVFGKSFIRSRDEVVDGKAIRIPFHVQELAGPVPGHPLIIGQDFGRDPCAVICQVDGRGRLLVLQEIISTDMGLVQHLDHALRPALASERFLGRPVALVGDPAGAARSSIYEETSFDVLTRAGFHAFPAPTNEIEARLSAIESYLLGSRGGGPALLIDPVHCPMLVRAMSGGYRYANLKSGQRRALPDKNEYSHIVDALQYAALAAHAGVVGRGLNLRRSAPVITAPPVGAWT